MGLVGEIEMSMKVKLYYLFKDPATTKVNTNLNTLSLHDALPIYVGAKKEIYELLNEFKAMGKAIIMISSDLPEIIGICDRVMVMCEGKVTGLLEREQATQENIMKLALR